MDPTFRLAEEKGYRLIDLIGAGRFGKVYRGEYTHETRREGRMSALMCSEATCSIRAAASLHSWKLHTSRKLNAVFAPVSPAAHHIATGKMAAIKVLTMQPANLQQLRSAEQEWQIMASLTHPHCVKVLTYYTARVMQRTSCLDLVR